VSKERETEKIIEIQRNNESRSKRHVQKMSKLQHVASKQVHALKCIKSEMNWDSRDRAPA
jgi:hypothetical protein